jgi:hypothetical protein
MTTASRPIIPLTQESLPVSAEQPVQSIWKRGLKRLFAAQCSWHKSSKGYGYSAAWVVVSASDGWASASPAPRPK